MGRKTLEVWYSIQNAGDGSAYPSWFESQKLAKLDQDMMDEGYGEPCIGSIRIQSASDMIMLDDIAGIDDMIDEMNEVVSDYEGSDYQGKYHEKLATLKAFKKEMELEKV